MNFENLNLKEIATKVVKMLENAPYEPSECVKVFVYRDETYSVDVMGQNSYLQGAETILTIPYKHPAYDGSEKAMRECKIRVTKKALRKWDWENFIQSDDFSNEVESVIYKMEENIREIEMLKHLEE